MIKNYLVGALTSKPYAFTARSWELRNTESLDVFDSIGSTIKLSTRGSSILRVLPKINDLINEEWITDKVRFSYDALKFQRIVYCYKKINNSFSKINWNKVFSYLIKNDSSEFLKVSKISSKNINFFVGSFVDYETLESLSLFKKSFNTNINLINSNSGISNVDNRSSYLFKSFKNINNFKTCLLIGCNLRLEAPILNIKLRRNAISKSLFVYNIGFNYSNNFNIKNIGNSLKKIKQFLEFKSNLNMKLDEDSLIIAGNSFLNIKNSDKIFHLLKSYFKNTNIIQSESSFINFYENGLVSSSTLNNSVNWLLDDDKTKILKSEFNIYQGHHNDYNFENSNLVLPSTVFSEKNGTFINFSGIKQKTKFVDSKILNTQVRDDSKIIYNLNDSNVFFNLKSDLQIYDLEFNKSVFKINNSPVYNYMEDFYRNDSITRNSPVMALVSNRVNYKNNSFK